LISKKDERKPASVLPAPVGARMSTSFPERAQFAASI